LDRHEAILLIGPTGSGKTPLGELLEESGLWGRPCAHFDFGRELRRVGRDGDPLFHPDEIAFIRRVLDEGLLLEDEHFHVAWKILTAFIAGRCRPEDGALAAHHSPLIVLNGLPRHVGQAGDVDCMVDVEAVIHLNCTPEVVLERIRTNAGGDRAHRADDALAAVRKRLADFGERTRPVVDHYAALGANIVEIEITPDTTPGDMMTSMEDKNAEHR
jgi:adenylate kinase